MQVSLISICLFCSLANLDQQETTVAAAIDEEEEFLEETEEFEDDNFTMPANTKNTTQTHTQTDNNRLPSLRDPYVVAYPGNNKLFCQIPMGGNTEVDDDFQIEVSTNNIQVWSRIPDELEKAYNLLGENGRLSNVQENCLHCTVFQEAIDERIKAAQLRRDEEGRLWVLEYNLKTPFEVVLEYFDKDGTLMDEFMVQSNGLGYYYAQFWLKAVLKKEGANRKKG
jgi:hypothetical protein